jgi:hypothetical protein
MKPLFEELLLLALLLEGELLPDLGSKEQQTYI